MNYMHASSINQFYDDLAINANLNRTIIRIHASVPYCIIASNKILRQEVNLQNSNLCSLVFVN